MSASPIILRMIEVSRAAALWLLKGSCLGRLIRVKRDRTTVRPARHVWEYGRPMIVRASAPAATVRHDVEGIRIVPATGWTVTVAGPAEVITDPAAAAHHRRSLSGRTHGRHDTLLRLHPKTVTGLRPTRAEA
ncbi:pyridoxamine 5'-phosphate oxidase family protein [Streptomyces sp. NPDC001635]